ncbi:unnamed protein product [Colias eurytheme]|nr:unnamed protein product [Colias eurytheme]
MVHVAKARRQKWDKKAEKHILIGYPDDIKGYRIYNPRTKCITTSREVIIMEEDKHPDITIPIIENERKENSCSVGDIEDKETSTLENVTGADETIITDETLGLSDKDYIPSDYEDASDLPARPKSTRIRKKTERYIMTNMCVSEEFDNADGLSIEEALQGDEKDQWLLAVKEELQCFKDNDAWELVNRPTHGETIVKCKWVLKKKCDSENNVRYRARLVAKGCSQKYGVDYSETFSPVVRHTTLRLLFALSVQLNLEVTHLDVKTAFLNGELAETIYMQKPVGYACSDNSKVLKLKKAIYGLKQASRAWHKKVDSCMLVDGYIKSKIEPCLYIKIVGNSRTIVALYVDDMFVFSNNRAENKHLKNMLSKKFPVKRLGIIKECLGMSVSFNKEKGTVTLNQKKYIDKLLSKFCMTDCKQVNTPMEVNLKCKKETTCSSQILISSLSEA